MPTLQTEKNIDLLLFFSKRYVRFFKKYIYLIRTEIVGGINYEKVI